MSQQSISGETSSAPAEPESISQCAARPVGRRGWLQFSLRALVAVMALASFALGWLGIQIEHARRQRSAVEAMNGVEVGYSHQDLCVDQWGSISFETTSFSTPAFLRLFGGDNLFADVKYLNSGRATLNLSDLRNLKSLDSLEVLVLRTAEGRMEITDSDLTYIRGLHRLVVLELCSSAVTDAGLENLAELAELESLELGSAKVCGTGLSYLKNCRRLESLRLWLNPITDEGARQIGSLTSLEDLSIMQNLRSSAGEPAGDSILESCANLRRLRRLTLIGTRVTGAGLRHLRGLPLLERLNLAETKISGERLGDLATLPALKFLDLSNTSISDADLVYIGRLTNLEDLHLHFNSITDAELAQLSKLTKLKTLSLQHTRISDSGLVHLHSMKNLEWIAIGETGVSEQGVEQLRLALPNTEVD